MSMPTRLVAGSLHFEELGVVIIWATPSAGWHHPANLNIRVGRPRGRVLQGSANAPCLPIRQACLPTRLPTRQACLPIRQGPFRPLARTSCRLAPMLPSHQELTSGQLLNSRLLTFL